MKIKILTTLCVLTFVLAGCSDETEKNDETDNNDSPTEQEVDNRISMPASSSDYEGVHYQEVIDDLQAAGFTNIETEILDDLTNVGEVKDGEVESVLVYGEYPFTVGSKYREDIQIVITYHTFPEETADQTEESEEPVEEVTEEEPEEPTEETADQTEESENAILTTENSEELATILSTQGEINPLYADFAEKYKGKTIEFDGHIHYIVNHGSYTTRWDILMSGGDWVDEETASPGPIFKFEDVGLHNLGIKDLYLPDFVSVGSNIYITAEVKEYNESEGVFYLKPISIKKR